MARSAIRQHRARPDGRCMAPDDKPTRSAAALPSVMGGPSRDFFRRSALGASSRLGCRLRGPYLPYFAPGRAAYYFVSEPTVALSAVG